MTDMLKTDTVQMLCLDRATSLTKAVISSAPNRALDFKDILKGAFSLCIEMATATIVAKHPVEESSKPVPKVPIKNSITDEHIICLEDGKRYKSLRRHLQTSYGLTPDAYRAKWGLPKDYPMVAPSYAKARSDLARKLGLGRKAGETTAARIAAKQERVAATVAEYAPPQQRNRGRTPKVKPHIADKANGKRARQPAHANG